MKEERERRKREEGMFECGTVRKRGKKINEWQNLS